MAGFVLGQRSLDRLKGVRPELVAVVKRAIQLSTIDFMVVEGVRSREQCMVNYGKGRTVAECRAKGVDPRHAAPGAAKVTWLNDPFASKHVSGAAVDLLPAPYDWKDPRDFDEVAKAMLAAAAELKVALRWGADWDRDGRPRERGETDSPHFELDR